LHFVVSVWLLKSSFAFRGLGRAAFDVRDALTRGDLEAAREALRSLCSRDPSRLDAPLLVAATVESVAENASDSVVAPLFYYALFGVPGAIAYRAVNTLDSMIGYHGRFEYIGKVAARLDDALNYLPARITAGLLLLGGSLARRDPRAGWSVLRRDGRKTESPNAGQPMATMAGLLGVQLEKIGHYRLGDPGEPLVAAQIDRAWRIVTLAACVGGGLALALCGAVLLR
jgi:adenosylcobinamide-phosphate synthase